jgi:NADH-quinone oxidoreductase subunit G
MKANINISEPKPPQDENSPLAFSMEGSNAIPPAELTTFFWAPGWNSVQATYKYLKDENSDESKKDFGIRIFK